MPSIDLRTHKERTVSTTGEFSILSKFSTPDALLNISLYRQYKVPQDPWTASNIKDNAYVFNAQFTTTQVDKLAFRAQAAVPVNVVRAATEQAVAMITTNKPKFQATATEDSDVKTAKVYTDLLTHIWDKSSGNMHLKAACYDYYIKGRGVLYAYVNPNADYGRGEIEISALDPNQVFPDPNSTDRLWRDAANIIVRSVLTRERIESIWPDAEDKGIMKVASQITGADVPNDEMARQQNQQIGAVENPDSFHDRYEILERYSKVKVSYNHVFDSISKQEHVFLADEFNEYLARPAFFVSDGEKEFYVTEGPEFDDVSQMYNSGQPSAENADVRIVQLDGGELSITLTNIADLVKNDLISVRRVLLDRVKYVITIGGMEYYNNYLPIANYPLVPMNNHHDRNPYPMGDIAFVRPMQDVLNKLNMQILSNLATTANPKLIVERGSVDRKDIEADLARAGPAVIEVNPGSFEPKVLGSGSVPTGLFQYFGMIKSMIEFQLGVHAFSGGDPQNAPDTFKGTLTIDEFGQRRIRSKLDDIETTLNALGSVIVNLIPNVYTEEKVIRLVQPNNEVKQSVANQFHYDDLSGEISRMNDLTVGSFDMKVISGSTLPSNRWALDEYYRSMRQEGLIDQVEVLKKSELIDMEGVLERFGEMQRMQQAIQQLQEKNKQLANDLQSSRTNEMTALKQAKIAAFDVRVDKMSNKTQAVNELVQQRLKDQLVNNKPKTQ